MKATRLWTVLGLLALTLGLCACASSTGGKPMAAGEPAPSDEEVIAGLVSDSLGLLAKGDVEGMMQHYADDFNSAQGDKATFGQFLTMAKDQGMLEGFASNLDDMTVTVDGDSAKVEGVSVEGAFGLLTLNFGLVRRDGTWLILSQEQL